MNKHLLLSGLLLLCVSTAAAQKKPKDPKFGEVEAWEWALSDFKGDTTVGAIEIFDIGKFEYRTNFYDYSYSVHKRVKILNSSASDFYGNLSTEYFPDFEYFSKIKAHVIFKNKTGEVVTQEIGFRDVIDERLTRDRRSLKVRYKRFSIPNVTPGSIIEIQYTKITKLIEPPKWDFQGRYPKLLSKLTFSHAGRYVYSEENKGSIATIPVTTTGKNGLPYIKTNTKDSYTKIYIADSIPAFGEYNFVYCKEDHIRSINICFIDQENSFLRKDKLLKSWFTISRDIQKNKYGFNEQELKEGAIIDLSKILYDSDTVKTIRNVYKYINQEIKTIKQTDDENINQESSLRKIIRDKEASLQMKIALALRLFSVMDYKPALLFIRKRALGIIEKKDPSLYQFQHQVVLVSTQQKEYLLDFEDPYHPFGVLPKSYYNKEAWLVDKDIDQFVSMQMPIGEDRTVIINAQLSASGELSGTFSTREAGYAAVDVRARWREKGSHYWTRKELFDEPNLVRVTRFDTDTTISPEEPAIVQGEFVKTDFAQNLEGELYLNPILIDRLNENPLKQPSRDFPVEFESCFDHHYLLNLELPSGYTVAELPKPMRIILPDRSMEFIRAVSTEDRRLTISVRHINRREVYPVEAYEALRKIYDAVVSAMAEQIILKPIK